MLINTTQIYVRVNSKQVQLTYDCLSENQSQKHNMKSVQLYFFSLALRTGSGTKPTVFKYFSYNKSEGRQSKF